jgi:8-oxo-dGTP pyrophosphatase MutT (NUDIX family)
MTRHLHEVAPVILATENYLFYDGRILIHRRGPNVHQFPGLLIGPGGRLDEGEDVMAAAAREIEVLL